MKPVKHPGINSNVMHWSGQAHWRIGAVHVYIKEGDRRQVAIRWALPVFTLGTGPPPPLEAGKHLPNRSRQRRDPERS